MRYPDFLSEGGTIGFVAPSFGCATEPYKTAFGMALDKFTQLGYALDLGPNCYESKGIGISNTPQACAAELTHMYESSESDVLISCGGGELMCEILEYVDFDTIKNAKPKWYLGYSDNTNFTFLQNTICDTAAVYGPCAGAFAMKEWHDSLKDTFDVLCGNGFKDCGRGMEKTLHGYDTWERESLKNEDNPAPQYNLTEKKLLRKYIGDRKVNDTENVSFEGRLIGGCMDCLVNLTGTTFDAVDSFNRKYAKEGIVWFLESCDLNVFAIRRAMWQMDNAGWFDNVKGFLIGRPLCFGEEMMGLNQYDAVLSVAAKYNVPVIMDCDFGHLPPSMPIISGSFAEINSKDNDFSITYRLI